jgi:hypothetical protein
MASPRRSRALRHTAWAVGGALLGVALAFLVLNLVARTRAGHARILEYTLNALARNVQGSLDVQRISGNLFEGARLYGVSLTERDGTPFVLADSADVTYDVRTLLSPRIRINRLVLYKPNIYVRRSPATRSGTTSRSSRHRRARSEQAPPAARDLRGYAARGERLHARGDPLGADSATSARAQREEVRLALRDTSPILVRRVRVATCVPST